MGAIRQTLSDRRFAYGFAVAVILLTAALALPEPAFAGIAEDINAWICGVLRDTCNWIFNSQVDMLRGIGVAAVYAGEGENTDFYCCFDAVPVYNAILSFTFSDACLTMLTGTRLFDNAQLASEGSGMDSVSALLRFVEIVRTEGYICSRIDSISAGYSMTVSRSGASELAPVWRIGTDTGVLLIDAGSGEVIK